MHIIRPLVFFFISLITVLAFLIFLLFTVLKEKERTELLTPIVQTVSHGSREVLALFTTGLDRVVTKSLITSDGTYSIVVTNLKTHETYSQNPDRTYESASLYKLWVMAATYQQFADGKLQKDTMLTDSVQDLNTSFNIASNEAEMTDGTVTLTVNDALEKAITISDNYSALLLTKKLGIPYINNFLSSQGLTHSQTSSPPVTTASDIALLYTKLYRHELVDPKSSEEMLALLKRQAINDRIPKYLPDGLSIAHKTGELDDYKHDAGIVFTPKGDYILVMLSQTEDTKKAAETMALLSQKIYTYFITAN